VAVVKQSVWTKGSSDKSHPWLFIRALSGKRGLRLSTKSIAYSNRFCRHIPVLGEGLNFSDLPKETVNRVFRLCVKKPREGFFST